MPQVWLLCAIGLVSIGSIVVVSILHKVDTSSLGGNPQLQNPFNRVLWYLSGTQNHWNTSDIAWTALMRENYQAINEEFVAFELVHLKGLELKPNTNIEKQDKWSNLELIRNGLEDVGVTKYFPRTMALIAQTPLQTAMFSQMASGAYLGMHFGENKGVLRYHLGLQVADPTAYATPRFVKYCKTESCKKQPNLHLGLMDLKGATGYAKVLQYAKPAPSVTKIDFLTWKNGLDLLFDDNFPHFVSVGTPSRRVILFGDIPRFDMPWPARIVNELLQSFVIPSFTPALRDVMARQTKTLQAHGLDSDIRMYALNSGWKNATSLLLVAVAGLVSTGLAVFGTFQLVRAACPRYPSKHSAYKEHAT